jgi:hypothetical protein
MLQCLHAEITGKQAYAQEANNYKKKSRQDNWFASASNKSLD